MENQKNQTLAVVFTEDEIKINLLAIESRIATLNEILKDMKDPKIGHPMNTILQITNRIRNSVGKTMQETIEDQLFDFENLKIKLMQGSLDLKKQTRQAAQS